MKLLPSETELVGHWISAGGGQSGDATCERIHWLAEHHLRKVAVSKEWGGWLTLYQDPDDGRYWERTYPQGEMQGGGPPQLTQISGENARAKYEFD